MTKQRPCPLDFNCSEMGLENGVCINRTNCVIGFVSSLGGQSEATDELERAADQAEATERTNSNLIQVEVLWLGRWYRGVLLTEPKSSGEGYRVRLVDGRERCIRSSEHIKVVQ